MTRRQPGNKPAKKAKPKYGIGEWFGRSIATLPASEKVRLAEVTRSKDEACLPRAYDSLQNKCTKPGGVCSLRLYEHADINSVSLAPVDKEGNFATLCPHRLKENGDIFRWVGELILGTETPAIVTEVGFLIRESKSSLNLSESPTETSFEVEDAPEDVGQIDYVLVGKRPEPLNWCALELQAVYFSGAEMGKDVRAIRDGNGEGLVFPSGTRRPDYRSSGPKRLMPQLQIKVPTLRRWGKKMAVVVDKGFFEAMGAMEEVNDISNCDIAWFVVDYAETETGIRLQRYKTVFTTLERAVEGLTAGKPVTLSNFEARIQQKLARNV